jgi:hypothetical protein
VKWPVPPDPGLVGFLTWFKYAAAEQDLKSVPESHCIMNHVGLVRQELF